MTSVSLCSEKMPTIYSNTISRAIYQEWTHFQHTRIAIAFAIKKFKWANKTALA